MKNHPPEELVHKYNLGICSEEERALVESWHLKEISDATELPSTKDIWNAHKRIKKALAVQTGNKNKSPNPIRLWIRLSGIAGAIFIISIIAFLYLKSKTTPATINHSTAAKNDILPGSFKAVLTLSTGQKITLNKKYSGLIAKQGKTSIRKTIDGNLIYDHHSPGEEPQMMNTLETPPGGEYQLTLPDGTKVWLNAGSLLTYPTFFNNKERKVELKGEAYFEVTRNVKSPFKVVSKNQVVEVLGTHFNILAYPNEEKNKTTLLEGSIRISSGKAKKKLKPGQEAIITTSTNQDILLEPADLEKNIAWKNGEFIFKGEDLKNIMKQISRWYNVEIVYQGKYDQTKYWGAISRTKNISAVLNMLRATGKVNFKIEERRVTVMN
ncbi:FecR family protein [Pedobacter caeni]|uniref:FecR family protein n=2 Tax=Pedobacter caeni TaxID=288992 RepID=A0A1M5H3M5_9SPHI|nr:FecR family protein [Pedobacter caeni]